MAATVGLAMATAVLAAGQLVPSGGWLVGLASLAAVSLGLGSWWLFRKVAHWGAADGGDQRRQLRRRVVVERDRRRSPHRSAFAVGPVRGLVSGRQTTDRAEGASGPVRPAPRTWRKHSIVPEPGSRLAPHCGNSAKGTTGRLGRV